MPVVICYLIVLHFGFEMWEDECASDGMLPGTTGTLHNRHVPFRGPENQFRVYASALCMLAAACCEM